jgi:hypothetical protein
MNNFQLSAVFCLFLMLCSFTTNAFACACCAEQGHYSIRTAKPSDYNLKELQKLKFQTAELYTDAGYPDSIKGISPLGEGFSVENLFGGKVWTLNFKDNNQKTGKLDLTKPLSMVEYMVDLPDGDNAENSLVRLYKEWRFKYRVQNATGIFKNGFAPQSEYFLVLQGYGNVCTSAADFTKWHLEISGKKADFSFFGNLSAGN